MRDLRETRIHAGNAGIPEAKDVVHHAKPELGLRRSFRRTREGIRTRHVHAGRRSVGGFGLQWSMLWFSAPSRLNQTFDGGGIKIVKYHEVVNMAITETITLPFGGSHTPRTCILRSVVAVLYRSPK